MKKLFFILAIVLMGCSVDPIEPNPTATPDPKCTGVTQLIQVTIDGRHVVKAESTLTIDCIKCGTEYDKVFTGDRLIQYKKYICN